MPTPTHLCSRRAHSMELWGRPSVSVKARLVFQDSAHITESPVIIVSRFIFFHLFNRCLTYLIFEIYLLNTT